MKIIALAIQFEILFENVITYMHDPSFRFSMNTILSAMQSGKRDPTVEVWQNGNSVRC